jgi:hypothetical protein
MSEQEIPLSKHDQLALAIAQGKSVRAWARANDVPRNTAQRWASDPDLRRQVEDWRRLALDQALGLMAAQSIRAVKAITKLGEMADSQAVQLKAWRAVLSDQIAVSKHANLEYRLSQIEERQRARTGTPNCQR